MIEVNHEALSRLASAIAKKASDRIARRARYVAQDRFVLSVDPDGLAVRGHGQRAFELEYGTPQTPGIGWGVGSVMGDVE
jgi:hypothetical protein